MYDTKTTINKYFRNTLLAALNNTTTYPFLPGNINLYTKPSEIILPCIVVQHPFVEPSTITYCSSYHLQVNVYTDDDDRTAELITTTLMKLLNVHNGNKGIQTPKYNYTDDYENPVAAGSSLRWTLAAEMSNETTKDMPDVQARQFELDVLFTS